MLIPKEFRQVTSEVDFQLRRANPVKTTILARASLARMVVLTGLALLSWKSTSLVTCLNSFGINTEALSKPHSHD